MTEPRGSSPFDAYRAYSRIYDFFSDPSLFTELAAFLEGVAEILPAEARVLDVGAGTGLYSERLLVLRPDLSMVLLEPSAAMRKKAERRLSRRCEFLPGQLEEHLESLEEVDVVLLLRTLHVFGSKAPKILSALAATVAERGVLVVYEQDRIYDLVRMRRFLSRRLRRRPLSYARFLLLWPSLKRVLLSFNERVASGSYALIGAEDLDAVLLPLGFELVERRGRGHVFRRQGC